MQIEFQCENDISFEINFCRDRYWYYNNRYHREKGPAVIYSTGSKFWYKHGKAHRLDGPAFEWSDNYKECWIEGRKYSEQQFFKATNANQI